MNLPAVLVDALCITVANCSNFHHLLVYPDIIGRIWPQLTLRHKQWILWVTSHFITRQLELSEMQQRKAEAQAAADSAAARSTAAAQLPETIKTELLGG